MPLDVQNATLASNLPPLTLPPAPGRLFPDPQAVARLADALLRARRPLILGGRGAVISGAEETLVALADSVARVWSQFVAGSSPHAAVTTAVSAPATATADRST